MKLLKTPRSRAYLGLAVLAAGLVGLALSGDLLVHATRFTAFYVLAGAGFTLLATAATSLPLRVAIVAAVILRLIFLPVVPTLSDDYHRYVWDGRVQLAGINPYRVPALRARARPRPLRQPCPHQPRGAAEHLPAADAGRLPRRRRGGKRIRAGGDRGRGGRQPDPRGRHPRRLPRSRGPK